jgi:Asp-tRNA(Asn)/Glu-tRNA(Gln) amidotransferase A subunit family amidase
MLISAAVPKPFLTLVNALRSGELPLVEYIAFLENQFKEIESNVKAFMPEEKRFERLRQEAEAMLEKYPQMINRPPLFGVPVGVKDIFHVDGFQTQAGSRLPLEVLQGRQSQAVTILREAGALILGKTVTTEFAYFAPGPTRNPNNLAHTPGGSSSGSAAAVAAGLCPVALGTQTIGSVIRPAAYCGIVGYKPSYDRISRAGVIPLSPSLDHIGVFTADVPGADLVASLLCPDWQLIVTHEKPVLGIPEGPYLDHVSAEGLAHFQATCQALVEAGYKVKSVPVMENFDKINARHQLVLSAEAAQVHAEWYDRHSDLYHDKTAGLIERGHDVAVGQLTEALAGRRHLRKTFTDRMDQHGLDLWIAPAAPGPAPKGIESTGDPIMNLPWTQSGLPSVSLPTGKNEAGLPMGLQVVGRWYEDEKVLDWTADLEIILPKG